MFFFCNESEVFFCLATKKGIENLLFLLETQQWMQCLLGQNEIGSENAKNKQKKVNGAGCGSGFDEFLLVRFPKNVPRSQILEFGENKRNGFEERKCEAILDSEYVQSVRIFEKYIKVL